MHTKKIIAFTGTHGTGKTTSAYELARNYKINHPGESVGVVADQEALCPYPINLETTPEAQLWIFTRQLNQELSMQARFNCVISDRTIVDVIAYTICAGYESLAHDMMSITDAYLPKYSHIHFKQASHNNYCYDDGIRVSRDHNFREKIERTLLSLYSNRFNLSIQNSHNSAGRFSLA